tara:strand:- start:625 stop:978 length:354 start_codon:yes stop_codon:yes gene_type:complete
MEQIVLNFDASEFDGFGSCREYLQHATFNLRDSEGGKILQKVIAAELDYSPSQWSQKASESGDARITLNDAELYTEKFGDVSWIHYLVYQHIIKTGRNRDALLKLRAQIDQQLQESA